MTKFAAWLKVAAEAFRHSKACAWFVKEAGKGDRLKVKSLIGSISSGVPDLGESTKHLMARIKVCVTSFSIPARLSRWTKRENHPRCVEFSKEFKVNFHH